MMASWKNLLPPNTATSRLNRSRDPYVLSSAGNPSSVPSSDSLQCHVVNSDISIKPVLDPTTAPLCPSKLRFGVLWLFDLDCPP